MSVKEKRLLEEHGTQLMVLKPSSIWQAAMEDLKRRAHNAEITEKARKSAFFVGAYRQYAFHREHVAKSSTANDLIRLAIAQPGLGQKSGKQHTRLIYSDIELLKVSLR